MRTIEFVPSRGGAPASAVAQPQRLEFRVSNDMNMQKAPFIPPASYEAALEELEQLVGLIESGQLPLEQLLTGYQRGAELLRQLPPRHTKRRNPPT